MALNALWVWEWAGEPIGDILDMLVCEFAVKGQEMQVRTGDDAFVIEIPEAFQVHSRLMLNFGRRCSFASLITTLPDAPP